MSEGSFWFFFLCFFATGEVFCLLEGGAVEIAVFLLTGDIGVVALIYALFDTGDC